MRRDQLNRRTHRTSAAAKAERPSSPQILQRGRAVRAGGGPRLAVVKTTPTGTDVTVDVYLDEDNSDTEVTVACIIYGGGYLVGAYPTLVDGMELWVQRDASGIWKNVTSLYKIAGSCNES